MNAAAWTEDNRTGVLLDYINMFTRITILDVHPECATDSMNFLTRNLMKTCIPFVLALMVVTIYIFLIIWGTILRCLGRRPPVEAWALDKTGYKVVVKALSRPLSKSMIMRLNWGVVRAIYMLVLMTALPSLLGLVAILDCSEIVPDIYVLDASRDVQCWNMFGTWGHYVALHAIILLIWLLVIVLFVSKIRSSSAKIEEKSQVNEYDVMLREHANSCKYGGTYGRFTEKHRYQTLWELCKKLCFVTGFTMTNTMGIIQVVVCASVLVIFGLRTLLFRPYRMAKSNMAEAVLTILAGITIASRYDYVWVDGTQRILMVFALLVAQVVVAAMSLLYEFKKRFVFLRHYSKSMAVTIKQSQERASAAGEAVFALRRINKDFVRDDCHSIVIYRTQHVHNMRYSRT